MRACVVNNTGSPEALRLQNIPDPVTREGEVHIRAHAFGINRLEFQLGSRQVRQQYPQGIDAVLDITGSATVRDTLQAIRAFGEVVTIGLLSGRIIEQLNLLSDLPNAVGLRFFSTQMRGTASLLLNKAPLAHIAQQRAIGAIPSIRAHLFDFGQIIQADELMASNQAIGKIVVRL